MGLWGKRDDMIVHEADPYTAEPSRGALADRMLTPIDSFYGRNHGPIPFIDPQGWRLRVGGLVEHDLELSLDDFDAIGSGVPLLVDLAPAGRYLMDDLFRAGGLLAVLREVSDLLDPAAMTVSGRPLADHLGEARIWDDTVIRPRSAPLQSEAGIAVLRGSLAPDGAVIKPAAASKELLTHRGRAVVFDSIEDMHARLDDPGLDVDASSVLVLRGCGPRGYPGMPEVGNMPLPARLLAAGVRDMVRISDARMSGTAYGTVVLHVAPEAAAGGPLALVRDGDPILLDVPGRRLEIDLPAAELARREPSAAMTAALPAPRRGW